MRSNKHNAALPPDYIPYQLRTRITQIDPKLDVFWQQHLHEIFTRITPQERKNIAEQLLTPNNIFWNSDKKSLRIPRQPQSVLFANLRQHSGKIQKFQIYGQKSAGQPGRFGH